MGVFCCHGTQTKRQINRLLAIFNFLYPFIICTRKRKEKNRGSATITNRSSSQTPRGRGIRQNQTSTNRTNVRKALRLALSSPNEVIAILKMIEKHKNKITQSKT